MRKATDAKTTEIVTSDTLIESKLIPIGDRPRNKPVNPAIPKLNATDKTTSSTQSSLFSLFANRIFVKQYPGMNVTKIMPKK
jgi:hypothetical protein